MSIPVIVGSLSQNRGEKKKCLLVNYNRVSVVGNSYLEKGWSPVKQPVTNELLVTHRTMFAETE